MDSLEKDDSIPREVTKQLVEWFGSSKGDGRWELDIVKVAKAVGSELLAGDRVSFTIRYEVASCRLMTNPLMLQNKVVPVDKFVESWREAMGEQYAAQCDLSLLQVSRTIRARFDESLYGAQPQGTYLLNPSRTTATSSTLTYFPISSLPLDPASRFSELFSVRQKWRTDEIAPFLQDLAIDGKKRDALTLKFVRKVKGDDGVNYYTSRGR